MKNVSMWVLIVIAALGVCGSPVFGGYIEDREAAMKLKREGDVEGAVESFREMANGEVTNIQASDALEQAVIGLIQLDQYDKARELAKQIPLESVSTLCQMRILAEQNESEAIVEQFGDVNIDQWPPMWRPYGYDIRGTAAHDVGDAELAVADLENAITYSAGLPNPKNDKAQLLNRLADTYQNELDDTGKALETYRRTQATGHRAKGSHATFSIADILVEQGKPEEALQVVEKWVERIDVEGWNSAYWAPRVISSHADLLARLGKKDAAIDRYEQALAREKIRPSMKESIEKRLGELIGDEARVDDQADGKR